MSNPLDPESWAKSIGNVITNSLHLIATETIPSAVRELKNAGIPVTVTVSPIVVDVKVTVGVETGQ